MTWATPHDEAVYRRLLDVAGAYMDRLDLPAVAEAMSALIDELEAEPDAMVTRLRDAVTLLRAAHAETKQEGASAWRQSPQRARVRQELEALDEMVTARFVHYPCPCCGHLVFTHPPGSEARCPVCLWEDDPRQLADPYGEEGENDIALRRTASLCGAGLCRGRVAQHGARAPYPVAAPRPRLAAA